MNGQRSFFDGDDEPPPAYLPRHPRETQYAAERAAAYGREVPRLKIYNTLVELPQCDAEIFVSTGILPNTARPRRVELVEEGIVVDSGIKRIPEGGRKACIVWIVVKPYATRAAWIKAGRPRA